MSFRFNHSREQVWGAVMRPASTKYIHLTPRFPYTQPVSSSKTRNSRRPCSFPLAYWNFDASHRRYFRSGKETKTSCFVLLSARLFVSLTLETNYFS